MLRRCAIVAVASILAYLVAIHGGFVADDVHLVQNNPVVHAPGLALGAFFRTYWPASYGGGMWRPLVILSFAIDWAASGGSTLWLHAASVLWHALASALLVLVLDRYLSPTAALVGGLVFALHPVHVEAVAPLTGRAEPMAAVFLFAAILLARRARAGRAGMQLGALGCLVLALLCKESAVVGPAIVLLDQEAGRAPDERRLPARFWVIIGVLGIAWYLVRQRVDAGASFLAISPLFMDLSPFGRMATALAAVPAQVRLLAWPFALSPDYAPQVLERLTAPNATSWLGLALLLSLAALAAVSWRRSRPVAFALILAGLAWLPVSNLAFPIVIAERTLYVPSVAVALLAGLAWQRFGARHIGVPLAALLLAFTWRTVTYQETWRSNRSLVLRTVEDHPESYRGQKSLAVVYLGTRDLPRAMRAYGIATELFDRDALLFRDAGLVAAELGRPRDAIRLLGRAVALGNRDSITAAVLAGSRAAVDSAVYYQGHHQ